MFLLIKNKNIKKSRNKTIIFIILCCCKGFHCSPSYFSVSNIAQTQCTHAWNRPSAPLQETDTMHPLRETDAMHPAWNHVNYKLKNTHACKYNLLSVNNFLFCFILLRWGLISLCSTAKPHNLPALTSCVLSYK